MSGECRNLVDVPAGAGKVSQTEMAKRVGTEPVHLGTSRNPTNNLRPTPDGDRFGIVAAGLREKERPALLPQRSPMLEVAVKQFTAGNRLWNDAFTTPLGGLRSNPERSPRRIDVVAAETAQLLTSQSRIISKSQHDAVANRLTPSYSKNTAPVVLVRNPWQLMMPCNQWSACVAVRRGVAGPHTFFHQICMEQSNHRQ